MNKLIFTLCLALMHLIACNPDKGKKVDVEENLFGTDASSLLFFKNTRSIYYQLEQRAAGNLDVYTYKDWKKLSDAIMFVPQIVVNWKYDEAYVLLEPTFDLPDSVVFSSGGQMVRFSKQNKEGMLMLATTFYDWLQEGKPIMFNGTEMYESMDSKEAFRITLQDYFRLTKRY